MKKLLIALLFLINIASAQKTYYVSASGDDSNPGSQTSPIKTISKAISLAVPGDRILLNGGESFNGSLVPKSGTANAPITYGSYGIGKAILSGFQDVTGWTQSGNIWTSPVSTSVNMVTVGGQFAPIGKWPNGNKIYNTIVSSTSNSVTSSTITGTWTGGQLVIRKNHWIIDKGPITSQSGSTVTYTPPNTTYNPQPGWGFFIQNHQSACDQQNEWFYSGGRLGIYSTLQPQNIKASTIDNLVQINAGSYMNFAGLQFIGSNSAAVTITSGHDIIFESCDFLFQGINGFNVQSAAHHIKLNNCTSNWTNNNFINAGGSTDWTITNNLFQNTATIAGMGNSSDGNYIAIYNIGANTLVQGNRFLNTGYICIDFRGPSIIVNKNTIDTFCTVKDDGGAIYTYSSSATTYAQRYVTNNTVGNGGGASAGTSTTNSDAFGIYTDNNSSDVTITDNYVHDCGSSGLFLHGSTRITALRNIIYNSVQTGGYGQFLVITDKSFADMRGCVIANNQFISKTSSQVAGYFNGGKADYNQWGIFDSNYYSGNKFYAGGSTNLAGWQSKSGMEAKSITGNPSATPPIPIPPQPPAVFKNVAQSKTFIKNNCTTGTGSSVVYSVPEGKYTSTISQADADAKATDDINANGQAYANTNGTCSSPPPVIYYNAQYSKTFTKNNCGSGYSGSSVIYTVAANKYSSTISQADADNKATSDVNTNGQNYANSKGICTKLNCSFWDKMFGRKGCHF